MKRLINNKIVYLGSQFKEAVFHGIESVERECLGLKAGA